MFQQTKPRAQDFPVSVAESADPWEWCHPHRFAMEFGTLGANFCLVFEPCCLSGLALLHLLTTHQVLSVLVVP